MALISANWSHRWPGGEIPFEVADDVVLDDVARQAIRDAIAEWNTRTPFQFVPHLGQPDFAVFTVTTTRCASPVGRQGGRQIIGCRIGASGFGAGNVIHEIGHTIGLHHEHQRRDRGTFVEVDPSFVNDVNYRMLTDSQGLHVGRYDCFSIMHYPRIVGEINRRDGQCLWGGVGRAPRMARMGQRDGLSARDINAARFYRWEPFAGSFKHGPAAASWGRDRLDLFAVGNDNAIYHKWWDGSAWRPGPQGDPGGWERFAGSAKHGPAVAAWGPNRLDLFHVGDDNAIYHKWWDGAWRPGPQGDPGGWERFAGSFKHGPAVASRGANRLDLFAVGNDNAIYHKWWDGSGWRPGPPNDAGSWERFAGSFKHGPAVASWGRNRLDLFAVGNDNAIYHKWWDGSAWRPGPPNNGGSWERFASSSQHGPAVASWGPNRLDLFPTGDDNAVYHKWWDGSAWRPSPPDDGGNWERFSADSKHGPAVASWGNNRLDLFSVGRFDDVYHMWWANGWNA